MEGSEIYMFTANTAGSEEADACFTVGVAEEFGPYFMIQRPLEIVGIQAEDLYSEFGDEANGGYGILESLTVRRDRLIARLGDGRRVEAILEISDQSFADLQKDLLRCFSGLENLLHLTT